MRSGSSVGQNESLSGLICCATGIAGLSGLIFHVPEVALKVARHLLII